MVYSESVYTPAEVAESPGKILEVSRVARDELSNLVVSTIAHTEISSGQVVRFVSLDTHVPKTETTLLPLPRYFVAADPDSNLTLNRERTNPAKLQQYVSDYLGSSSGLAILRKLGIEDVGVLLPKEGVELAMQVVAEHLMYDDKLAKGPFKSIRDTDIYLNSGRIETKQYIPWSGRVSPDYMGTTELLENGLGVCRNYAEACMTVFQALKDMQSSKSQLANTYLKVVESDTSDSGQESVDEAKNEIMDKHRWIEMYSVQVDGSILASVVDPTFLDSRGTEGQEQTSNRYALSLLGFYNASLIDRGDLIDGLEQGLVKHPDPKVEVLLERLMKGNSILQIDS